ncbi:hypothetical protein VP1G_11504 [Cytospora mali]|uniref:Uncharacterized protein n=1 Tax=Cytospora mali TaxID=578113 RepID=A0A194VH93_CYTMA|nr:hypothetical protein VP1G_11504 [Valsa mali var. pyri (nom. inval.)]
MVEQIQERRNGTAERRSEQAGPDNGFFSQPSPAAEYRMICHILVVKRTLRFR